MRYYPNISEIPATRESVDVFRGYNHNLRIGDGEFFDMKNLSSLNYPVLSPRQRRGVYAEPETAQGLIGKDSLCYVDGSGFVINDERIEMGLTVDGVTKTLISMGAYIIIMPDKKYINTEDLTDYGTIEASVTTSSTVTFTLCKNDGSVFEGAMVQDTAPANPDNMDLWIDTSSVPHALKQYSATSSMWVSVASTYIKISATGIGADFAENDGVNISGITSAELADLNTNMIIWSRGDDYIVVTGILDAVATQDTPITITRQMPAMDFIIESENRLWGCRYGKAQNGEIVNEIYASKLGDFKNWNCFMGISTDSYAASVGTDGAFTGAITHMGYPLFFKEGCMHKVYGNYPSNYQIQTTVCRGVQQGCSRSIAIVNEVLYYKARSAVCAYDGSLPVEISSALGDVQYGEAVAGALGNKYYISMRDIMTEANSLFVYDTLKGMWHREDETRVLDFCNCRGELYYIDAEDGKIRTVLGSGVRDESPVKWMAETGVIGTDLPDKKYISRLDIRMKIEIGAHVFFYIQYDSSGAWEHIYTANGERLRSFSVPIRPLRCDHFRLRIEGDGDADIYSICKTIEQGSDI
ncbi:MAG: hypothetical protein ACI3XI_03900 [Eubacteriales bacterium]